MAVGNPSPIIPDRIHSNVSNNLIPWEDKARPTSATQDSTCNNRRIMEVRVASTLAKASLPTWEVKVAIANRKPPMLLNEEAATLPVVTPVVSATRLPSPRTRSLLVAPLT